MLALPWSTCRRQGTLRQRLDGPSRNFSTASGAVVEKACCRGLSDMTKLFRSSPHLGGGHPAGNPIDYDAFNDRETLDQEIYHVNTRLGNDEQGVEGSQTNGPEGPSKIEEPDEDERGSEVQWSNWGFLNYRSDMDHGGLTIGATPAPGGQQTGPGMIGDAKVWRCPPPHRSDFVVAWMLLQRSGLEVTDRSVIAANLKNQFTTARVKKELRLTWLDEELKRRDAGRGSPSWPRKTNDEDQFAYQALEKKARMAFVAMQGARRTVREAREAKEQEILPAQGQPCGGTSRRSAFSQMLPMRRSPLKA